MTDHSVLDAVTPELLARLQAAEDACRMYGWSPTRMGPDATDRDKAAYILWCRWADLAGPGATDPKQHPHLFDAQVAELAAEADRRRDQTLEWIRGHAQ